MYRYLLNDFVTPEIGLELKKIGFNEPCYTYFSRDRVLMFSRDGHGTTIKNTNEEYNTSFSAPSWTTVFDFFDKKGFHCMVSWNQMTGKYFAGIFSSATSLIPIDGFPVFDERYDANVAVIEQAIKIFLVKQ